MSRENEFLYGLWYETPYKERFGVAFTEAHITCVKLCFKEKLSLPSLKPNSNKVKRSHSHNVMLHSS